MIANTNTVGRNTLKEDRGIQELKSHKKAEERRKLLEWMNPVFCTEKHATSRGQRNPETGRWIFQNDQFVTWNNLDRAFLWFNGQAGHGKTILVSVVVDEIQGSGKAEPQTLGYFYCNFIDDRTTNAAAVLRSLIVQLLQQSKDDWITKIDEQQESNTKGDLHSLRNLRQQKRDAKPHPTDLRFLRNLLVEASTLVRRPVLVIDALDECKDYPDLVGHLVNLAEDARLRLFVTGRSEQDIQDAFHDLPILSLKDSAEHMKADICAHITEQLKTQRKLSRLSDALKKTILEKLLGKAGSMFRWVQCQVDKIVACKGRIYIEAPSTTFQLDFTRRMIGLFRPSHKEDQATTKPPGLNEAMMIEVGQSNLNPDLGVMDPMDIVAACGSLVTYNEKTRVVALSHYSVKEYLISRPNNIFKSISDMHARICELLITYVLCDFVDEICAKFEDTSPEMRYWSFDDDLRRAPQISKDHPLLGYAVRGWKHLEHVSDEDPCVMDALSQLNSEFIRHTKKHLALATARIWDEPKWLYAAGTLPSLLFIPLVHGKPWMVEFVIKQQSHLLEVDIAPGWGSPLMFAIAQNPDLLSILLKLGVDLNRISSISTRVYNQNYFWDHSFAPLSWAAATGSGVAMGFLMAQTEVDIPDDILHMAVMASKPSHEFIRKFRQRGADVNLSVRGGIPIHDVLFSGFSEGNGSQWLLPIVKALVEPPCDLSLQDWSARTALHIALDARLEDIVAYLLEQNARLSATATLPPDMWSWATNKAWFPKVQAAALAANQPCRRNKRKVIDDTTEMKLVEFSVAVTADHDNPNPICAVVVPTICDSKMDYNYINADLSYCNQPRQKEIQDPTKDAFPRLEFHFSWDWQRVSSRLLDYHQGDDKVTRMLQQLNEDKDSTGTPLFFQMSKNSQGNNYHIECVVEFVLDIYRGPLP
ncbi:hypothetical protein BDR03DRAFT_1007827 [Suillus americanus]|nr:hypothetical protein BDR03DRAFT_1007827 [Suillus americanus]